ncbi:MAG: hypothetical protein IKQ31_02845 [Clostridia bacterium]|nr:hypothetical protein [Clostridia bacterium]
MQESENDKLAKSLLKKAMGYTVNEVVEEYVQEEDDLKLVKKKITTKHIPPDISAARALLEKCLDTEMDEIKNLSDEELESLRQELIQNLGGGAKCK